MQDPNPDADPATSEGIFVFTSSAPTALVGDSVRVNGRVQEFRPGGSATGNLTTTELSTPTVTVLSSGNPLPAPVVIGNGGRVPPDMVIEDDASGSVETSGVFDPAQDGLDFYESLEGMRVQLNDAVAVGPTATSFGETPVVGDNGANASVRTYRGGLLLRPDDGNPERVTLDDLLTPLPNVNVGDHYSGAGGRGRRLQLRQPLRRGHVRRPDGDSRRRHPRDDRSGRSWVSSRSRPSTSRTSRRRTPSPSSTRSRA